MLATLRCRFMAKVLASWFGTGLILRRIRGGDDGSGTVGSVVAFGLALALGPYGWQVQLTAAVVVTGLSVWSSHQFAHEGDPGWIVIDEAAGTLVATIGVGFYPALVGLVVFRVADITKRFPLVRAAERLPGGVGITADDVVAGLWGLGAAWAATWGFG